MPLQVRRGTETQRTAMVEPLASGELLYVTTTGTLYIGNGNTLGGIAVANITEPGVKNIAGAMFTGGTHTGGISFVYDGTYVNATLDIELSNYQGTIRADAFEGSVFPDDSSLGGEPLVDAIRASINLNGTVKGNIVPDSDSAYDIGSSGLKFRDLYLSGTSLHLGNAIITASGSVVQLPAGSTVGGVAIGTGTGTGTGDGVIEGSTYKINIAADDSSLMINTDAETITASGGFIGDLTGNITGNVTGDVTGDVTGNGYLTNIYTNLNSAFTITARATAGNTIALDVTPGDGINVYTNLTMAGGTTLDLTDVIVTLPTLQSTLLGNVTGNVIGNVTGDVLGNLDGDVKGSLFSDGSAMIVDGTSGNINANVLTVTTRLDVDNIKADSVSGLNINVDGTTPLTVTGIGTFGPTSGQVYFNIKAAKGTLAAPTTTAAGDLLGGINIQGYNGTDYKTASIIASAWEAGAVLSDSYPKSKLQFGAFGGGTTIHVASLDSQGVFTAPVFKAANYATGSYPASPAKGWMIFDSTTNKFMGYNGTAWVAFTGP